MPSSRVLLDTAGGLGLCLRSVGTQQAASGSACGLSGELGVARGMSPSPCSCEGISIMMIITQTIHELISHLVVSRFRLHAFNCWLVGRLVCWFVCMFVCLLCICLCVHLLVHLILTERASIASRFRDHDRTSHLTVTSPRPRLCLLWFVVISVTCDFSSLCRRGTPRRAKRHPAS